MGSKLCEDMIMEIMLRSSLKTLNVMRCTSNDLNKLTYNTYFLDHYKKKHFVCGCLLQNTIRGCINIQEFASSPDSNTLDLNFLPYNAKVLACSEQGIVVFNSPNPRFNMKDLYHICKPTTQQVLPLPNPKTKYTTQKVAILVRSMNPLHYKIVRLSKPKTPVLQTKDKKLYSTHRVEIFDSARVLLIDLLGINNPHSGLVILTWSGTVSDCTGRWMYIMLTLRIF
nr:hypothetical protein [Tanacetum cinerariifolium]